GAITLKQKVRCGRDCRAKSAGPRRCALQGFVNQTTLDFLTRAGGNQRFAGRAFPSITGQGAGRGMSRAEAISDDEDGGELVAAGHTRTGRARGRARSLILYVGLPLLLMGGGGGLWLPGWPGAELLGLGPSAEPSAQARP